ncbi:MAG: hypothetical protein Q4B87_02900 [Candidatus Saccharibacteria bacterium]|nr:hypothetical protein [Candidatus Saccharibacteria bacterium]
MAEKLKTQTLNLPNEVVDSAWKDDIDVDYAIYGDDETKEGEYISPDSISKESLSRVKDFQVKLAFNSLKKFREKEQRKLARAV